MSSVSSNLPFSVDLISGNKKKPSMDKSGEYEEGALILEFLALLRSVSLILHRLIIYSVLNGTVPLFSSYFLAVPSF
jgi:hypothetical protein